MAAASDGRAQLGQQVSGSLSQVPRTHELLPEVEGLALQARRHLQVRPAPLTVSLHHPSGTSHDFGKIEDDVARTFHASRGTHKPSTRSGNREFAAGPFSPQNATLRTKLARSTHPLSCTPPSATTTWGHPRASSRASTTLIRLHPAQDPSIGQLRALAVLNEARPFQRRLLSAPDGASASGGL